MILFFDSLAACEEWGNSIGLSYCWRGLSLINIFREETLWLFSDMLYFRTIVMLALCYTLLISFIWES